MTEVLKRAVYVWTRREHRPAVHQDSGFLLSNLPAGVRWSILAKDCGALGGVSRPAE